MHSWILANLSKQEQRAVVRRAEDLLDRSGDAVRRWMGLRDLDAEDDAYRKALDQTFTDTTTPCPFLIGGRCSIYEARPSICRAYGRMMRTEDDAYYCDRIANKAADAPGGLEAIELPVFQGYHHAVLTLHGNGYDHINLLPVWVLSHRAAEGTLVDQAHPINPESGFPVVDGQWAYDDGASEESA